jgi:hypothetical protein
MKKLGLYLGMSLIAITLFSQNRKSKTASSAGLYGRIWVAKPGDNYAVILAKLEPGDELLLHEGVYEGSALMNNSGSPEKPISIRGYGKGEDRPVLSWKGTNAVLLQVAGSNLIFDFLEFRSKYTYSVRIGGSGKGSTNVTIKNCVFFESGGGAVSANGPVGYDNIHILDNYFIGPQKTPVYIGDHSGRAPVTNFTFKGNVIDGSQIYGGYITGYGIETKLNVKGGVIENNYITNTKGPGIMVYGAENGDRRDANIVRNNIIVGSRNDAGIVVGGGPSIITDNLSIGNAGGIEVMNYGGRNLLDHIVLRGNTAVCNRNYGMSFGNVQGISAQDNVVLSRDTVNRFIRNAGSGSNRSGNASRELETLVHEKLMHIIPARTNLKKIWLRVSSGPLTETDVRDIVNLVLEYKIPLQMMKEPM